MHPPLTHMHAHVLQVDEASVVKDIKQYTYAEGNQYVFMDMVTLNPRLPSLISQLNATWRPLIGTSDHI